MVLSSFTFMKTKTKNVKVKDPSIENALDVLSNIVIDMYLAMTPEQRKSFIKTAKDKEGKK